MLLLILLCRVVMYGDVLCAVLQFTNTMLYIITH